MKNLMFLFVLMLFSGLVYGKKIDEITAKKVCETFVFEVANGSRLINSTNLKLVYKSITKDSNPFGSIQDKTYFYIFNTDHGGYIIVAGDDRVTPILGYSFQNKFNPDKIPEHVVKWLDGYKKEICNIIDNNIAANQEIVKRWAQLIKPDKNSQSSRSPAGVEPLLKTKWDQSPYVNALCPGGSVTGCGATAMAQVMKYWNYPKNGTGFHSYNHNAYGTLSVNFANTTYDWANMPNVVNGPNQAVATLMYHCGVSQEMDYTPQVSTSGLYEIRDAFKSFFGYKPTLNSYRRADYTDNTWINLLKTDLDNSRPVFYRGAGTGGGHFFILDGYDNNNFFHINWGWGGYFDGYFVIDGLNPGGVGTGGGTGGYNSGHYAILGIEPEQTPGSFDLSLYSAIEYNPTPILSGTPFTVTVKIVNAGTSGYSGEFCAGVFTNAGVFVDYIEILQNQNLENGFYNNYTFNTTGITFIPGKHTLAIYYRQPGKEWVLINQSSFINPIEINIPGASNDLKLYSKMKLSQHPIIQDQSFSITVDVVNYGTSTFKGWISADIFDKEGNWIQTISEIEDVDIPAGYYLPDVYFQNAGLDLPPGSYYIALFNSTDYDKWTLLSNNTFENPITADIIVPAIVADIYEDNNTSQTAYNLNYTFSGNSASIVTPGANLHNHSDYDFYTVSLPEGFDYQINAKVGDRFNNIDNDQYDADVLFSYDYGNGSSDAFDFGLTDPVIIKNGGIITFYVSPYSAGETGTYLLDINITRTQVSSSVDLINNRKLVIFPNPSSDDFYVKNLEPGSCRIKIFNDNGVLIKDINHLNVKENSIKIDGKAFKNGLYYLQIQSNISKTKLEKIIILK